MQMKVGSFKKEDDCAQQVLNSVGERIVCSQNRRERVEALAVLVDIPYFSSYSVSIYSKNKARSIFFLLTDPSHNARCNQISYSSSEIVCKRWTGSGCEVQKRPL